MRDILFRGKTLIGKWIQGDLLNYLGWGKVHIAQNYKGAGGQEVVSETVGQYTGLKDSNGKKIFEGDVIAGALHWLEQKKNGVVIYRDGSFGLLWYRGEAEQFNPFTSMCNITYEVIGNIHDNPDLLKGGEG